jgi:two-component system NtrC family sensor kinase
MAARLKESYEALEAKLDARTRELKESVAQQAATAEVLKAISRSRFDPQSVLETLINSATALSGSTNGMIWRLENGVMQSRAFARGEERAEFVDYMRAHPQPPGRGSTIARVALTGEVQNIADVREDPDYSLDLLRTVATRATLGVPMKRGDELIGAIIMSKPEAGAYPEPIVELTRTFADQAVIAIENARLFGEVQARTHELEESLARQTATADVLKIISRSIADAAPVFETILESCQRLFDPYGAAIYLVDGDMAKGVARWGFEGQGHWGVDTTPLAGSSTGQAIAERRAVQFADLAEKPDMPEHFKAIFRETGGMTVLYAPMLSGERGVGSLIVSRRPKKPFSDTEIDFVQTFADQAVIAIENARLFEEVQARTRDLTEALQMQTATSDVLKVISRSAFDLDAVFTTLLTSAIHLSEAHGGAICVREGEAYSYRSVEGTDVAPQFQQFLKDRPASAGRGSIAGRAILSGKVEQIYDVLADAEYQVPVNAIGNPSRAMIGVPMLRDDRIEGVLVLIRAQPGYFSQRQIGLIQTFADQAVIAIENVRLFDEVQARTRDLEESLAQQTATADVLKVISRSMFDLQGVFDILLKSAIRLVGVRHGMLFLRRDDGFKLQASDDLDSQPAFVESMKARQFKAGRRSAVERVILTREVQNIADLRADPEFDPALKNSTVNRALLGAPMKRGDDLIGVIVLARPEPGVYSQRQIELVETFADQAVIAIENARLFDEVQAKTRDLEESLAQQTATADVLKVISRSAFDLDAIFQTLVTTAVDLCKASSGTLCVRDGEFFRYRGMAGPEATPELQRFLEAHPLGAPTRQTAAGRAILSRQTEQIEDVMLEEDYAVPMAAHGSPARSLLAVPLMGKTEVMGAIVVARAEPGAFPSRHVEILRTFADQAVIAIENSRLFEEVRARTRDLEESLAQQTATADVLKVISRSAFDLQSVSNTLLASAAHLCEADRGAIYLRDGDLYRCHATFNHSPEAVAFFKANPRRLDDKSIVPRVVQAGAALVIEDVLADATFSFPGFMKVSPSRALLGVPLLREDRVEGVFSLARDEPSKFSRRQIELVQTFADQALIAVENTRLFDEVQARTRELEASLSDLRKAQDRLVQSEKLASLGQLTAGIAHEIKNPLNFVNNFATLSRELLEELREALGRLPEDVKADADDLMGMIDSNLEKVASHGKRADSIVKNMLLHSREGSGERARVNVNSMVEEALNLGYHGARAEKPGFNVTIEKALDPDAGEADLYLQEVTRVLLNLVSNGLYATAKRKENEGPAYQPTLTASTHSRGQSVEIRIRDNGTGIPEEVRAKMFNPFFTTKPAGEGTGLGLSLSHDIVVKQHGGTLDVETAPGAFTEFIITLPREGART